MKNVWSLNVCFILLDFKSGHKPQAIGRKMNDHFSEIKSTVVDCFKSLKMIEISVIKFIFTIFMESHWRYTLYGFARFGRQNWQVNYALLS